MEKIEKRQETLVYHKFYCDDCGEFLGECAEDSNGHCMKSFSYHTVSVNNANGFFAPAKKFKLDGVLCDKCRDKQYDEICKLLKNNGFKEIQWCKSE